MSELEIFTLPDGGKVATGNLVPAALPRLFSEFDDSNNLDDKDIEKLLKNDVYKQQRTKYSKWVIQQSSVGKCNTSAAVGGLYRIRDKAGMRHVPLADNHLYWRINGGQDQGSMLHDGMRVVRDGGVSSRILQVNGKDYRIPDLVYNVKQLPAGVVAAANADGQRFKSFEPRRLPEDYKSFVRAVASALARGYVIVFAWHVGNASMRLNNGYAVPGNGPGNHATLFHSGRWVGGQDLVHPDCLNSWGPTQDAIYGPRGSGWGDGGYGLFTMQQAFACRRYHDFYVMTGCCDDPQDKVL